jgi:hypothetical protein
LPIYAQWKWNEKTETFLLIFHLDPARLDADGHKPNLRIREMNFSDFPESDKIEFYVPCRHYSKFSEGKNRNVVTWAPSPVETGLLQELLSYANIINGFKLPIKLELRQKLEVAVW